jgi:hypothetical protein
LRLSHDGDITSRNQVYRGEPNDVDVRISDEVFLSCNGRACDIFRND